MKKLLVIFLLFLALSVNALTFSELTGAYISKDCSTVLSFERNSVALFNILDVPSFQESFLTKTYLSHAVENLAQDTVLFWKSQFWMNIDGWVCCGGEE